MTNPVVVQGVPVSSPHGKTGNTHNNHGGGGGFGGALDGGNTHNNNNHNNTTPYANPTPTATATPIVTNSDKHEKQETRCRDPLFALLFYANVAAIAATAAVYGPDALSASSASNGTTTTSSSDYSGYVIATVIIALFSFGASALGVMVMMCIPETLIKISLIFTVVLAGVWMVLAFLSGSIFGGILGVIFFAISLCYARAVWSRIPFATVNLVTGCTAIKANWGVIIFAYMFTIAAAGWSILWSVAFAGVFDKTYTCNDVTNQCSNPNYGYLFLLFVAFFFGHQVIQNSVHVTCAGAVGSWWFNPEDNGCCASGVVNAFVRTLTTSFGSICFGSLIVAIIQALKMLASTARANDDGGIMTCIAECLLNCLAQIVEYFNMWAFVFVGIYGFGYLEAGKNVFTLFKNRGWEAIIADDLVGNTLLLVSLIVGGVMGGIGVVIEKTSTLFDEAGGDATLISFILGFVVGLVICSIALSTIGSAVNSVIVLFADAPQEFQQNYPELSNRMRQIWSEIYPGSV